MAASETLPALIRPTDLSAGRVFPRLADIRRATLGSPARAAQHGAHANVRHVEAPMYLLWYGTWQLGRPCRPLGDDSWEAQQLRCAAGTSMIGSGRAWSDCRARRRISTRVAAETIKKAIEEGHCGSERAVQAAKEGDACLQVRKGTCHCISCLVLTQGLASAWPRPAACRWLHTGSYIYNALIVHADNICTDCAPDARGAMRCSAGYTRTCGSPTTEAWCARRSADNAFSMSITHQFLVRTAACVNLL